MAVTAPVKFPRADPADRPVRQLTRAGIAAVWAAAAIPMAALAWLAAPAAAGPAATPSRFMICLVLALTAGLIWQALLVALLVRREQGSLRPATLRSSLWLQPPTGSDGLSGGRLWLRLIPWVAGFAALSLVPVGPLAGPASRNLGRFLGSPAGQHAVHHAWALLALLLIMLIFNTVLGEELLFRGYLLPRMQHAFGSRDRAANAIIFGLYHLHEPWSIPSSVIAGLLFAHPTRRYHSAWMGIAIHSAQSIFFALLILKIVV
jgi:uncharacterized protein